MSKFRCSHILLSHVEAEAASHLRTLGQAMQDAEQLSKDIKQGKVSFQDVAAKNSHCASGPRFGGDLGWKEEWEMPPDFVKAVLNIPIGEIGPPIITEAGVHIVLRTG